MPDYSKGKIYKIECNTTGEVYYGSTIEHYMCDRMTKHRYDAKKRETITAHKILNRGNYNYKVVEYFPCNNKTELQTRERWWIENNVCINRNIPLQTRAEYYEKNRDERMKGMREYYENNKERLLKQQQEYRQNNIELVKSKENEKFTCECGGQYTRTNKSQHIKTKKHQDFISSHIYTPPSQYQR